MHGAMPQEIDPSAPVIADHEITIAAPLRRIWELHIDVSSWPTWQRDITNASLASPLVAGASFDWTTYGMTIRSTVYAMEPERRILWGGGSGDIMGIHDWLFRETRDGVVVQTRESFGGPAVVAGGVERMQALLDRSLIDWLERLKATAEAHQRERLA